MSHHKKRPKLLARPTRELRNLTNHRPEAAGGNDIGAFEKFVAAIVQAKRPCCELLANYLNSSRGSATKAKFGHKSCIAIMSVLLETSVGDLVIDLLIDDAPKACEK